jgi:hypothetical protein
MPRGVASTASARVNAVATGAEAPYDARCGARLRPLRRPLLHAEARGEHCFGACERRERERRGAWLQHCSGEAATTAVAYVVPAWVGRHGR